MTMTDKTRKVASALVAAFAATAVLLLAQGCAPDASSGVDTKKQAEDITKNNRPGDPEVPKSMQTGIQMGRPGASKN